MTKLVSANLGRDDMARMYSHKGGKHGSHRPVRKGPPAWVAYKKDEVEKLVIKLRQQGLNSAMLGLTLRDQYGIPSVKDITGKSITQILKENKLEAKLPEDLLNLIKKAVAIKEHLAKNKKDLHSKKGMENAESKIRRLAKYYKSRKILPADWAYEPEKAKLLVQQQ